MKTVQYALLCLFLLIHSCQNRRFLQAPVDLQAAAAPGRCGAPSGGLNTTPGYDGRLTPLFPGLGDYTFPVSTNSTLAQQYFNQGMMLAFGFNHAEAARSFRETARLDPDCAMAYWGLGWVLGPNYNAGMESASLSWALDAIANAKLRMHTATPMEQVLIKALDKRYPRTKEDDPAPCYLAFADAMRQAMKAFPDDLNVALITAEALMNLHPWDLYQKDGTTQPWTPEITEILEGILMRQPGQPQAIHLYIHAMEASTEPEKALLFANALRFSVPGSGHLTHMPSHIFINTGHYHEGTLANERAVKTDSIYLETCHAAGIYPLAYYPHNWHFLAACAALEGNSARALQASRFMADHIVDKGLMLEPGLATLQHYYTIPWYIMVKFARWDEILQEPMPDTTLVYPAIILHYARGMAFAAKGNRLSAKRELQELQTLSDNPVLASMTIWDINSIAQLVDIAATVLKAEIDFREGDLDSAILAYRKAVQLEADLNYNEPPDWFFSIKHALGHVLLEAGQLKEAEQVYRSDLSRLKNNGWALMGLYQSLLRQGREADALTVKKQFDEAWQWSDVVLKSSVL